MGTREGQCWGAAGGQRAGRPRSPPIDLGRAPASSMLLRGGGSSSIQGASRKPRRKETHGSALRRLRAQRGCLAVVRLLPSLLHRLLWVLLLLPGIHRGAFFLLAKSLLRLVVCRLKVKSIDLKLVYTSRKLCTQPTLALPPAPPPRRLSVEGPRQLWLPWKGHCKARSMAVEQFAGTGTRGAT